MDFEMKNLEMIEASLTQNLSHSVNSAMPQSLILSEISKENEELQVKLKLNYRRLLLFETENNKLIEEKNKFFFEMQNYFEKNQLLTEKNIELEKENEEFNGRQQLLNEKVYTLEKINISQLGEIKRFSKFHIKIQNVVKPFILDLKIQLATLKQNFARSQKLSQALSSTNEELQKRLDAAITQKETLQQIAQTEKNNLISTYEEQIHSFSKEILELQNKDDVKSKEISRLKKALEFKNYFENELIKFKRIHELDQTQLNSLIQAKTALELQLQNQQENALVATIDIGQLKVRLEEKESTLEVTRHQLTKHIDESLTMNERLNRLEKLNNQLSREMSPT
ncbi:MAG: hypothetical protein H7328_08155 [Bdellovibrio sp.]|nr:hypothetical protein [Bdellovibrio sp.]